MKRSMVFIDGSNVTGGWWTYCRKNKLTVINPESGKEELTKKVNYAKLIHELTEGTDFIRGYYYDAIHEPNDQRRERFFDKLRTQGITVVTKPLRYKTVACKHCKHLDKDIPFQKGIDVAIVTEFMSLAIEKAYDIAIIVSGDSDFVNAINYVKRKGLVVCVVSFNSSLGEDTMRAADRVIKLDTIFENISA